MFGLSFSELMVIVVVALLVVGPDDLPRMVRAALRFFRSMTALGQDIRRQMEEVIGDEELGELRKLRESIRGQQQFIIDQQGEYREVFDISELMQERPAAINETGVSTPAPAASASEAVKKNESHHDA
ncbi:MAG: Sec-independent protein translocase protein TatB [Rickettsiales bacterium]|nr:Sec-independent protein translocase protein TatB [Rickettsiales bacterium]